MSTSEGKSSRKTNASSNPDNSVDDARGNCRSDDDTGSVGCRSDVKQQCSNFPQQSLAARAGREGTSTEDTIVNGVSNHSTTDARGKATGNVSARSANRVLPSIIVQERENFLLFVKILFKILEEAREPETRARAQRIVLECRRRSQQGDPNFIPLMEATERRLRLFVGENKWQRAHLFLHHYKSKRSSSVVGSRDNMGSMLPVGAQ